MLYLSYGKRFGQSQSRFPILRGVCMDTMVKPANQITTNHDSCDLMKFIFSILIFAMHINPFHNINQTAELGLELLARGGVPFFFIASAYFLFCRQGQNATTQKDGFKKYVRRIAYLYLFWFVINLPSVLYTNIYLKGIHSLSTYTYFIKKSLLSSTYTGSWYMASSIFSAIVIYALSKRLRTEKILLITFPFFLCCSFASAYSGVLPSTITDTLQYFLFPLNIFAGLFYFAIGKLIAEQREAVSKIPLRYSVGLCVLFYVLYLGEIFTLRHFHICGLTDVAFFIVPTAIFCFISTINSTKPIAHSKKLRKMSTIIYCSQGNVLLSGALVRTFFHTGYLHSLISFAICCVVELIVLVILLYLQKKKKNWAFLRYAA